jgi:hypothetical protein
MMNERLSCGTWVELLLKVDIDLRETLSTLSDPSEVTLILNQLYKKYLGKIND